MKTLDSLIEQFESSIAELGIEQVSPVELVDTWEANTVTILDVSSIAELLRVWLEYRFAANLPVTPAEACDLFPCRTFTSQQLAGLEFEYRRLIAASRLMELPKERVGDVIDLPPVGVHWDDFQLLEILGEGAFARVYLARQLSMAGRLVALKLTFRITRESQLLARLHHSAIVPVYSLHRQAEICGLCMPYLGNTTLLDLLREIFPPGAQTQISVDGTDGQGLLDILGHRQARITTVADYAAAQDTRANRCDGLGPPPEFSEPLTESGSTPGGSKLNLSGPAGELAPPAHPVSRLPLARSAATKSNRERRVLTARTLSKLNYAEAITWIGAQLADALDHAHRHGVLHCDIKPANVLLGPDGQARLLDFNVSLEHALVSPEARVGGTLAYMAPEHLAAVQGLPHQRIDRRSDIYALGVVLFELLTGSVPKAHANDEVVPVVDVLRNHNPSVSPALAAIVAKCLCNAPDQRYASADQLYDDLNAQCNHLPLLHQPEPSLNERTRKWIRRHPLLSSVTSLSLVASCLVGLSLLAFAWRGQHLAQLKLTNRSIRIQQILPEAIALASACGNYPDLAPQARHALTEFFDLLAVPSPVHIDRRLLPELSQLQTLVHLCKLHQHELLISQPIPEPLQPVSLDPDESEAEESARLSKQLTELGTALDDLQVAPSASAALLEHYFNGRYSNVIELRPSLTKGSHTDYAVWLFLGHSYLKTKDFSSARECFSVCTALQPKIEVAWFYRGIARLESEQHLLAIDDFLQALALQPDFPSARYDLALAYEAVGQTRLALEALNPAVEAGWQRVTGFAFRSQLHARLGNAQQARLDLESALACNPTSELDWFRHGVLLLERDPSAARNDFEQALKANPGSIAARKNLAHVLAEKLAQPEESLVYLNQLVEMVPEQAEHWSGRGVVLARLERIPEAIQDLTRASKLKNTHPLVAYQIACGYSLVAAHQQRTAQADSVALEREPSTKKILPLPSQGQVTAAAVKWYKYALQNQPDIARIALQDPDISWLRQQAEFQEISLSLNTASSP